MEVEMAAYCITKMAMIESIMTMKKGSIITNCRGPPRSAKTFAEHIMDGLLKEGCVRA